MIDRALHGSRAYWLWLGFLAALIVAGTIAYINQLSYGLGLTGMGRDVSWGLYIANFTFMVGVAASAVTVVIPYRLHHRQEFQRVIILGEFLSVAAVVMAMLFVIIDLGQPGRLMNLVIYASPNSVLFWDVMVLSIYLVLNLVIGWTTLDSERKMEPEPSWVKPLIILSVPWAISIHTVTAFIYSGLAARPFWLTALMAPRFLASAFASGPALFIIACLVVRRFTRFDPGKEALNRVAEIATYSAVVSIFFWLLEAFTVFYSGEPDTVAHFRYLLFGTDGRWALVPWAWTSIGLAVLAVALLIRPATRRNEKTLVVACIALFVSLWIDKGLGLIVPGFIPSPVGTIFEYTPTITEGIISLGVIAIGLLLVTVFYKVAVSVLSDVHPGK